MGNDPKKLAHIINDDHELLMNISNMVMYTYVVESALLRTEKLVEMKGKDNVLG